MVADVDTALRELLEETLPALFKGTPAPVGLTVVDDEVAVDQRSEAAAAEPRPDDACDTFPFDPGLTGFTLTRPPYPGPRRVQLLTSDGDVIALGAGEIEWDEKDACRFTLCLGEHRDVDAVTAVQVVYATIAVFTTLSLVQTTTFALATQERAASAAVETLVVGVVALNREWLREHCQAVLVEGDYGASVEVKQISLSSTSQGSTGPRLLKLQAEVNLKATRALRHDEGRPIVHIRSDGRPGVGHQVDFQIPAPPALHPEESRPAPEGSRAGSRNP